MKKACMMSLVVFISLFMVSASFAALKNGEMQLKSGDEVYVCGCGEGCPCLQMSKKPGKCACGNDLVKSKVIKVEEGKAIVMVNGKEKVFPTKGKYVCACGSGCNCDTVSQSPGKCSCGSELKEVGAAKSKVDKEHSH
jgi:hypothetical protein